MTWEFLGSAPTAGCASLLERMSADGPKAKDDKEFDVVMLHGTTDDGQGARVVRARPGRLEAGEVRPVREGRPLMASGEVVRLERREDAPALFDVHVQYKVPAMEEPALARGTGPAQIATPAYRDSWERTFGASTRGHALN